MTCAALLTASTAQSVAATAAGGGLPALVPSSVASWSRRAQTLERRSWRRSSPV